MKDILGVGCDGFCFRHFRCGFCFLGIDQIIAVGIELFKSIARAQEFAPGQIAIVVAIPALKPDWAHRSWLDGRDRRLRQEWQEPGARWPGLPALAEAAPAGRLRGNCQQ